MDFAKLRLDDSFEVAAEWWLPEKPEVRVHGVLSFSQESGARLKLHGVFDVPQLTELLPLLNGKPFEAERVFGEAIDGGQVTLERVFLTQANSDGSQYFCHRILAGALVADGEALNFSGASFSFDNLPEWSSMRILSISSPETGKTSVLVPRGSMTLLTIPASELNPEVALRGWVESSLTRYSATFDQRVQFHVGPSVSTSVGGLIDLASNKGRLLTILMGEPAWFSYLHTVTGPDAGFNVLFQRSRYSKPKELSGPDMPLSLSDLGPEAANLFSAWLSSVPKLRPVYAAFFSSMFNDAAYVDSKFQSIMQAIESFHRRARAGKYLGQSDYDQLAAQWTAAIPSCGPDLRQRLKEVARYGNEFSLRKRFKGLLGEIKQSTRDALRLDDQFVSKAIDTRNYYAHLDDAGKTDWAYSGRLLFYANQRLSAFLIVLLLKYCGISEDTAVGAAVKGRIFDQ